ncbi:hypothetical protein FQR65_LT02775 [Abscondita terminalis]|nr:hypothetical protein FQR65_LT02775 [Abscondita terminalis]
MLTSINRLRLNKLRLFQKLGENDSDEHQSEIVYQDEDDEMALEDIVFEETFNVEQEVEIENQDLAIEDYVHVQFQKKERTTHLLDRFVPKTQFTQSLEYSFSKALEKSSAEDESDVNITFKIALS